MTGALAASVLALAPAAQAGEPLTRFAEPGGNGPAASCPDSDPCSLHDAVGASAPAGSQVFMKPGTYTLASTVAVANNIDLRSETGFSDDVVIDSSADVAVFVAFSSGNSELEDFTIEHDTAVAAGSYGLHLEGGIARRLFVDSGGSGQFACHLGMSLLRDSICVNTRTTNGGIAVGMSTTVDLFPALNNVTAVATGPTGTGLFLAATANGADPVLTGRNVIAEGALTDQQVSAVAGASAVVNMFHSNFDSVSALGSGGTESVTNVKENDNQNAPELLDADYRQLQNSPTIDAGDNSSAISAGDIDGDTRIQGDAVDIGADEFQSLPTTRITRKPAKKTRKRTARFRFTSDDDANTFECKLDSRPYRNCQSGVRYRRLSRKRHIFRVRAVNVLGDPDPTPATYRWKVKK